MAQNGYLSVRQYSPEYTQAFDLLINKPFGFESSMPISITETLKTLRPVEEPILRMNETFSDMCYTQLLDPRSNCQLDFKCIEYYANNQASRKKKQQKT